jgi:hypothetical protein
MPVTSKAYTLSNTVATLIVDADNMPQEVHLHNMTKSSNEYIYIGTAGMSMADAIHLDPGESLTLTLNPKDALYGMSDPNGLVVGVLAIRKND